MKKSYLLIVASLAVCLLLFACKKDPTGGNGSIEIAAKINDAVNETDEPTRAISTLTDLSGYNLKLTCGNTEVYNGAVPEGGVVGGLADGRYVVELSDMAGFVPAFDAQRYAGQTEVTVAGNKVVATVAVTQANAGLKFDYSDPSLAGRGDINAIVSQDGAQLDYGRTPDATGYFKPGSVTMQFKSGDTALTIGGMESVTLTLEAADLVTYTIKPNPETGAIELNASINDATNPSPAAATPLTDFTGYTLKITDGNTEAYNGAVPAGATVNGIAYGSYTVELGNMAGFEPAFGAPRYAGRTDIALNSEKATAAITLTQANAGLRFDYTDPSLTGRGNVVATVSQGMAQLNYGATPDATGYFPAGSVTVQYKIAGEVVTTNNGMTTETLNLAEADLITHRIILDAPDTPPVNSGLTILGAPSTAFTVKFVMTGGESSDPTIEATTDASGKLDLATEHPGRIIKSIRKSGSSEIYIGRSTDDEVAIKLSGNSIAFRDVIDGYIPIGTYAEFNNIRNGLSGKYRQDANIEMMNVRLNSLADNPYGSYNLEFTGEYDGAGFSMRDIYVAGPGKQFTGLFGINAGYVHNMVIESGRVTTDEGLAGVICGRNVSAGRIEFIVNNAEISSSADNYMGGIVGQNHGTIRFCGNRGIVSTPGTWAGGICGANEGGTVAGCYNKADQPCQGNNSAGITGLNTGTIIACYNIGNMQAPSNKLKISGVVGGNEGSGLVYACYSVGNINGLADFIGGVGNNTYGAAAVIRDSYWSICAAKGRQATGSTMDVKYFTDGTTAPSGVDTGWPSADAAKGWGIHAGGDFQDGYYWKNLGQNGTDNYPILWWE